MPLENFGQVVAEVQQFGFADGPQVNIGRIKNWVNEAQRQIARQIEAPEFQKTENLQLVIGTFIYNLPVDFLRLQDIYYPEMIMRLMPLDVQRFDETAQANLEGPPVYYLLYRNEIKFFPVPNARDKLELHYLARPPALERETDVPVLHQDYFHLLVEYALGRAFKAEDDEEAAQAHIAQYKQDLDAYASDMQRRDVDRPRQLDGTWGGTWGRGWP